MGSGREEEISLTCEEVGLGSGAGSREISALSSWPHRQAVYSYALCWRDQCLSVVLVSLIELRRRGETHEQKEIRTGRILEMRHHVNLHGLQLVERDDIRPAKDL